MSFEMPSSSSSYYTTGASFGIFFACLNIYILTLWLAQSMASPVWLVGTVIGAILLLYSIRLVRVQQVELIEKKQLETITEQEDA
jgi:uncharacterized protein (DUF983 family)